MRKILYGVKWQVHWNNKLLMFHFLHLKHTLQTEKTCLVVGVMGLLISAVWYFLPFGHYTANLLRALNCQKLTLHMVFRFPYPFPFLNYSVCVDLCFWHATSMLFKSQNVLCAHVWYLKITDLCSSYLTLVLGRQVMKNYLIFENNNGRVKCEMEVPK